MGHDGGRSSGSDGEAAVSVDGTLLQPAGVARDRPAGAVAAERYQLRGEIARGGMGIILDGVDPMIRRELVIRGRRVGGARPRGTIVRN
jgi:hypothetical protein